MTSSQITARIFLLYTVLILLLVVWLKGPHNVLYVTQCHASKSQKLTEEELLLHIGLPCFFFWQQTFASPPPVSVQFPLMMDSDWTPNTFHLNLNWMVFEVVMGEKCHQPAMNIISSRKSLIFTSFCSFLKRNLSVGFLLEATILTCFHLHSCFSSTTAVKGTLCKPNRYSSTQVPVGYN